MPCPLCDDPECHCRHCGSGCLCNCFFCDGCGRQLPKLFYDDGPGTAARLQYSPDDYCGECDRCIECCECERKRNENDYCCEVRAGRQG